MTNRFMVSVAAVALIAGAGFAHAQGTGMGREGSPAGSAQQSAPSSGNSAAPSNRGGGETTSPSSGMKGTQSEEKSQGAGKNQRVEDKDMQKSKGMSAESDRDRAKGGKDMKAEGREGSKDMREGSKDMKAEGREGRSGNMNAQGRDQTQTRESQTREGQKSNMNADQQKGATDRSQMDRSQTQTTGQAGAAAKLSTEQRTKITTVIRDQRVEPLNNVNFSVSVGTRVPRDVRFHPLPQEVVTIYPEWRGYEFVLVNQRIVVVDPRTFEIVAVLDA